jgi:hypothetical protein
VSVRKTLTLVRPPAAPIWIVWRYGSRKVKFTHPTKESAEAEASRLAKLFPGGTFYVCQAVTMRGQP